MLKLISFVIVTTLCCPTLSQNLWTPVKTDSNVTVYTKLRLGKSYRSFKAVAFVTSTPDELAQILDDVAGYEEWFAYLDSARLLEARANEKYLYLELDFPWPFANEDMIFRITSSGTAKGDRKYLLQGMPFFAPPVDGVNRMRDASGLIHLEPTSTRTKVTFVMHMELSGDVPPWLANRNIHFLPLKTMKNLSETAKSR